MPSPTSGFFVGSGGPAADAKSPAARPGQRGIRPGGDDDLSGSVETVSTIAAAQVRRRVRAVQQLVFVFSHALLPRGKRAGIDNEGYVAAFLLGDEEQAVDALALIVQDVLAMLVSGDRP